MRHYLSKLAITSQELLHELKGTHFFSAAALILVMLLIASLAMFMVEPSSGGLLRSIWDSIWWALVTVTTVGYGDIVPKTVAGRLIAFGIMISGLFLVSLMTASIASVFVSRKIREGKGLEDVLDRDHIVICGWNDGGLALIQGLANQLKPKVPVIVLVVELPREEVDSIFYRFKDIEFRYVRGNFTKEDVLARANVRYARAAIILSDTSGSHSREGADQRTIFGCLAIKSMAPKVKTCAELKNPENKEHLKRANVDEIVVQGEYNASILASAATAVGLSTVMKRLLDIEETNQLWRTRVPERYIGHTIEELSEYFRTKHAAILLAIVTETSPMRLEDILSTDATAIDQFIRRKFEESGRDYFAYSKERVSVQINPPPDYVLTRQDAAIVLSRTRPGETSILEKSLDLVSGGRRSEA